MITLLKYMDELSSGERDIALTDFVHAEGGSRHIEALLYGKKYDV